jgi:DNA-binding response OmpR family regulator
MPKPFLCAPRRAGTSARERRGRKRRRSMLLIEDNPMVVQLLSSAIEECGFIALATRDFEGFKHALDEHLPDAVAMDLSIPDCEGSHILEELAAHQFGGLVLIISGLEAEAIQEALLLGRRLGLRMAKPLAKPFRFADLAQRLEEAARTPAG